MRVEKITLADVAREAGVSALTVSRLMRGSMRVNADTRARIQEAAKRLGFDLESRKTSRIIAFLLSNRGVLHPFHSSILMGANLRILAPEKSPNTDAIDPFSSSHVVIDHVYADVGVIVSRAKFSSVHASYFSFSNAVPGVVETSGAVCTMPL